MKIGYARVSTEDQKTGIQKEMLKHYGCEIIFEDKVTGVNYNRDGLNAALTKLQKGDELVAIALDRVGRSMLETVTIVIDLDRRGITFVSLRERYFDTTTPIGRGILALVASIAEDERIKIKQRTCAGIKDYMDTNKQWGRKVDMNDPLSKEIVRLLAAGNSIRSVADLTGTNRGKVYRIKKRQNKKHQLI